MHAYSIPPPMYTLSNSGVNSYEWLFPPPGCAMNWNGSRSAATAAERIGVELGGGSE